MPAVVPWGKIVGFGLIGIGFLLLLWSWHSRGQEITRLQDWQTQVVNATTAAAGLRKTLAPSDVTTQINALGVSLTNVRAELDTITEDTRQAKERARVADERLAAELARFDQRYAAASRRIATLEARKPVAPADVCPVLVDDTKDAWEGWK